MKRVAFPLLLLSSATLAAAPPSPRLGRPDAPQPVPGVARALRFPHPLGDAFLLRPAKCSPACPLVVVSHSRGMTAGESLTRPHLRALFGRLTGAGYAVLVSNDAGETTWGAPQALTYNADMRHRAVRTFAFNGRTYNMGYSMGGLPALLAAYMPVYPVSGVVLLDAQVSLLDVWKGINPKFREDVRVAHGLSIGAALPANRDPVTFAGPQVARVPLLVAGSTVDQAVPFKRNGEAIFKRAASPGSRLVHLPGPHLGGSHFGKAFVDPLLTFLNRLERRAGARP